MRQSAGLLCVLDFAGKPALPALLGRGAKLAGSSGYWVGHSGESLAVELIGPGAGLCPAPGDTFWEVISDQSSVIISHQREETGGATV